MTNQANLISADSNATQNVAGGTSDTLAVAVNGATTTITLAAGNGFTKAQLASAINAGGTGGAAPTTFSAAVVNDQLVLTATTPGQTIAIANTTTMVGFTAAGLQTATTDNKFASSDTLKFHFEGGGLASQIDLPSISTTAGTDDRQ